MTTSVEQKVIRLINHACALHATDIHIIPKSEHTSILFRISYRLIPFKTISKEEAGRLISYLKFKADMDIGERRKPQNGSFQMKLGQAIVGLRLSTLPSLYSESLVIRILPRGPEFPPQRLSLFPRATKKLLSAMTFSHGLIILTGPTGSGKTTTLYSLLQYSRKSLGRNVITLEDPIEKSSDDLLQVQVNEKAGITYSSGLKAILRHDPDVIMIGEIRDGETARTTIRASLSGHLVLTTMHTKDAKGAIYRLLEFGVKFHEIEQSLIAVTAQRLVELVCPFCQGECPVYCDKRRNGRTSVFEILFGNSLKQTLLSIQGKNVTVKYETLAKNIAKGVALGFIKEKEFERWVHDFDA